MRKDKDLVVTKPDKPIKGLSNLISQIIFLKTKEILHDNNKFMKLEGDWFKIILKLEDKLNRLLRIKKNKLPESCYD